MKRDAATLEKIIRAADSDKCFDFFIGSSSGERAGVRMLVEEITPWVIQQDKESTHAMIHSKPGGTATDRRLTIKRCRVLGLCVLATGSLPQMKKLDFGFDPFDQPELLCQMLEYLQVPWLNDWVEHLAKNRRQNYYQFLIEAGLARMPEKEGNAYVLGFLGFGRHSRLEKYGNDENFLKTVVWRFFEVEGDGDRSLSSADKYCGKPELTWAYALKELSDQKKLSRDRLLDASLEALARDFPQYRSSWYSRFHEYLEPTPEERTGRINLYLPLLASTIPPTVSFALNALKIVHDAGKLPAPQLLLHLPPALLSKSKGTVLVAVTLLETIAEKEPKHRATALNIAIEGLISEIIQVQERVVKVLTRYSDDFDDKGRQRLSELADTLSPSSRKKMADLLPGIESAPTKTDSKRDAGMELTALVSPLDPSRQIIPIADADELIERASYLLENPADLTEAERIFDALVRISLKNQPEMIKLGQPLLKRAIKLLEKHGGSPEQEPVFLAFQALLVRSWLQPDQAASFLQPIESQLRGVEYLGARGYQHVLKFPFQRLTGILESIARQQHLPLLSTPTHLGFGIDPRVLVERVAQWQKGKVEPHAHDVVVAFLRMGKEHRKEALKSAKNLGGDLGSALRYALGADEKIGREPHLWIAASRARFCDADDPAMAKAFPDLGPGAALMPKVTWEPGKGCWKYIYFKKEQTVHFLRLNFRMEPPVPSTIPLTHLTVLLHSEKYCFHEREHPDRPTNHSMPRWAYRVFLSYWPSWREPVYHNGLLCCGDHTKTFEVGDHGIFVLFEALSDTDEKFGPNARLLLNFGLSCPHADGRASAINAFVSGINSGRLNPKILGQSMLLLFTSGLIQPARMRKSLDEVVRVSPNHRRAVLDYLTELLRGDPAQAPDNSVKLLELYYELLVEYEENAHDPEVLAYLKSFPGGGRAAKLANQIVVLP